MIPTKESWDKIYEQWKTGGDMADVDVEDYPDRLTGSRRNNKKEWDEFFEEME